MRYDLRSHHERRRAAEPATFICKHCSRPVDLHAPGTRHRNHCPWCLWSLHVDDHPGDRQSTCGCLMEPIGIWVKRDGEWAIIHRCTQCDALRTNRIAGDDNDWALMALASHAIRHPPIPLDVR
ncbi:MAG: RNHCP domain-containing protein [Phycisphaeraceae bacterium]|nr:RNHCP domain-containing protein [Phycisphaeraceae bacterium]